jgi:Zn-dependent M28 family amino/carboxypeptidase
LLLALALSGCSGTLTPRFDGTRALQLAAVQMQAGPRPPGSSAAQAAASWIAAELEATGWAVEVHTAEYRGVMLRNVIGRLGDSPDGPLILATHYDTRPFADRDPADAGAPVPGANDGASGVAVLLELARVLPEQLTRQEVWLAFFDGEDSGGLNGWEWHAGASAFAAQLSAVPQAVIVADMVGDADLRLPVELNSDPALVDEIWRIARAQGAPAFVDEPGSSIIDDHRPFVERGIPAVNIIDIDYPYWHTTADTLDKISAESLSQVGRVLESWVLARR